MKKLSLFVFAFAVGLVLALAPVENAKAQSYSIDWHKIAGGGASTGAGAAGGGGANYQLGGTIGQHDARLAGNGGQYSITGGFWVATQQVVQTPGAPTLYITSAGNNTVTLYWQDVPGWSLQQTSDLTMPSGWSASSGISPANGTNVLVLANPPEKLFFRLVHP
jgi:hypothetical protein